MATVHCRASVTHFFANRDWYTFDLMSSSSGHDDGTL
jgi:hypothetical protein